MNLPPLNYRFHNQHDEWMLDQFESITHTINKYFDTLTPFEIHHHIETFYQIVIQSKEEPFEILQFKNFFDHFMHERHDTLIDKMKQIMIHVFTNKPYDTFTNDSLVHTKSQLISQSFYNYIEKDFNHFIQNTILYVEQWQHAFTRLKPVAFIIGDSSDQKTYQEICFNHDLLCLSKTQYQDLKNKEKVPHQDIYHQYIKRQLKRQRDIHIFYIHQNYIKHLQKEEVILFLTYDHLTTSHHTSNKNDLFILPIPEDLVEFERWSNQYLKTSQYILWLKNDALLTHYKSIPKHVEVIIDVNVICQEILNINPLEPLSFHRFQYEVVPLLREMHQTFRIKKIKHYILGYALAQNDILHRCLTLGFRHFIIHRPHLSAAIEESLKFIHATTQ